MADPWDTLPGFELVVVCQLCGADRMFATGSRKGRVLLQCSTCRAQVEMIGADVRRQDGELFVGEDLPKTLAIIGQDRSDPWVPLRMRLKRSAREVIQRAARTVRAIHGRPHGPLTIGWALEMICADFLAGEGVSDEILDQWEARPDEAREASSRRLGEGRPRDGL